MKFFSFLLIISLSFAQNLSARVISSNNLQHDLTTTADSNVTVKSRMLLNGPCTSVYVDSNYTFLQTSYGIMILRNTGQDSLQFAGQIISDGTLNSSFISGGFAFLSDIDSGLVIYDISNPTIPVKIGTVHQYSFVDILVDKNYLFGNDNDTLKILNVTDPSHPVEESKIEKHLYSIHIKDTLLYGVDENKNLEIYDLSDLANIQLLGYYYLNNFNVYVSHFDINGNYAYVANGNSGLRILDISNPQNIQEAGYYNTPGYARNVYVRNDYAYVILDIDDNIYYGPVELKIYDVKNVSNPVEAGSYSSSDYIWKISFSQNNLYLANNYSGLSVLDASNPANPVIISNYDLPEHSTDITISNNNLFITYENDGLVIYNITDSTLPVKTGSYQFAGYKSYDIKLSGNYAFINQVAKNWSPGNAGIRILNISDVSNPFEAGFYQMEYSPESYTVYNNLLFLSGIDSGLKIVDVSNPGTPSEIGTYLENKIINDLFVSGNYLFASENIGPDSNGVIHILDISSLPNVNEIAYFDTDYPVNKIFVKDNLIFTVTRIYNTSNFKIFDISDITNPTLISQYPGGGFDLIVKDNFAYVIDEDLCSVIDISDASNPVLKGFFTNPGTFDWYLSVSGNDIYMISNNKGLYILRNNAITGLGDFSNKKKPEYYQLSQNYPNPFNPTTIIRYSIPEGNFVTIKLYDVLGNELKTLVKGYKPAGQYEIRIDGSELPSGVYFYRLEAGSFSETKKMILLR